MTCNLFPDASLRKAARNESVIALFNMIEYIFDSSDLQTFASAFILDDVEVKAHTRVKVLVHEEESQKDN